MDNAKTHPADAIKSGVLLLKRQGLKTELPVEAFGDIPVTYFLLEEVAGDYGFALKNKGRKSIPLIVAGENYARQQNRPFSRALWALNLNLNSALGGDGVLSCGLGRVSGVRELSAAKRAGASGASHGAAGAARAGSIGNQALEETLLEAERQGIGFRYHGRLYLPVDPKVVPK